MKRPIYSAPDSFSLAPLLSLLPVTGSVNRLTALTTPLYARYEKVRSLLAEEEGEIDRASLRSYAAEEAMLRQVLDWLSLHGEKQI